MDGPNSLVQIHPNDSDSNHIIPTWGAAGCASGSLLLLHFQPASMAPTKPFQNDLKCNGNLFQKQKGLKTCHTTPPLSQIQLLVSHNALPGTSLFRDQLNAMPQETQDGSSRFATSSSMTTPARRLPTCCALEVKELSPKQHKNNGN